MTPQVNIFTDPSTQTPPDLDYAAEPAAVAAGLVGMGDRS